MIEHRNDTYLLLDPKQNFLKHEGPGGSANGSSGVLLRLPRLGYLGYSLHLGFPGVPGFLCWARLVYAR